MKRRLKRDTVRVYLFSKRYALPKEIWHKLNSHFHRAYQLVGNIILIKFTDGTTYRFMR